MDGSEVARLNGRLRACLWRMSGGLRADVLEELVQDSWVAFLECGVRKGAPDDLGHAIRRIRRCGRYVLLEFYSVGRRGARNRAYHRAEVSRRGTGMSVVGAAIVAEELEWFDGSFWLAGGHALEGRECWTHRWLFSESDVPCREVRDWFIYWRRRPGLRAACQAKPDGRRKRSQHVA